MTTDTEEEGMKSNRSPGSLVFFLGVWGVAALLSGCVTFGPSRGLVEYGYPPKQEVRRVDNTLIITNYRVNETTGQWVKTTFLTNF